ncbi:hypothetical protein WME75_41610 [Sorangium sp. So ce1014]|uniref:hypothetical protein n=1 Tax=Sorangium sp. So ce1014 TaxID=3133326 RepID=UPI003F5D8AEA
MLTDSADETLEQRFFTLVQNMESSCRLVRLSSALGPMSIDTAAVSETSSRATIVSSTRPPSVTSSVAPTVIDAGSPPARPGFRRGPGP